MGKLIDDHLETFLQCRLDLGGSWIEIPPRLCDVLNYSEHRLREMKLEDLMHPDHKAESSSYIEELRMGELDDFSSRLKLLTSNGDSITVFISCVLVRRSNGKPDHIICHIQNLSSQDQVLQKLEEREQQFKSLFKNNPHPVYYFDLEGKFEGVNEKLVEFTGLNREELLKKGFEEFIVEEDLERTKRQFKKATKGNSGQYEIRVKVKDGVKDIRVTKFPRYFGDEVIGVFGILQDITEEKRSKRKLEKSEQHFKSLFERNPDAVYSFDTEGNFIEANKSLEKLTGYSIEELKSLNFEPLVATDDREKYGKSLKKQQKEIRKRMKLRVYTKMGKIFMFR